jgi:hypothetical protein
MDDPQNKLEFRLTPKGSALLGNYVSTLYVPGQLTVPRAGGFADLHLLYSNTKVTDGTGWLLPTKLARECQATG